MFVADAGYDPQYGARPLKRAIQKHIEDPLAEAIIGGSFKMGDIIEIRLEKKGLKKGETPDKLKVTRVKK